MQNAECRMQNNFILHFAFRILHFKEIVYARNFNKSQFRFRRH